MWTGIVEWHNRLSTVFLLNGRETRIDKLQGLFPCNAAELAGSLGASAFERRPQAVRTMHDFRIVADFSANGTTCEGIDTRTADFNNVLILNRDGEATCISTIQRTNARGGVHHAL